MFHRMQYHVIPMEGMEGETDVELSLFIIF